MQLVFPNVSVTDEDLRLLAAVAAVVFTAVLLVMPPVVWLNVRRLRIGLHADLEALRASVDRLAAARALEPTAAGADASDAAGDPVDGKIGFTCPECGKFFEGPAELAGSDFACPECGVKFHIH